MRTTDLTTVASSPTRTEAMAMHPAGRPRGGARMTRPSQGGTIDRTWLDRLFRLPVLTDPVMDDLLPFAASGSTADPARHQRVTVLDGALDEGALDALARLVGPGLTLHIGAVEHGDIVVTSSAERATIDGLHAVGDTIVVTLLERHWGHDAGAVTAALEAGADACVEAAAMPEVAAHLRAVARRHQRQRSRRHGTRHLEAVA